MKIIRNQNQFIVSFTHTVSYVWCFCNRIVGMDIKEQHHVDDERHNPCENGL